jgi:hypothetical protein
MEVWGNRGIILILAKHINLPSKLLAGMNGCHIHGLHSFNPGTKMIHSVTERNDKDDPGASETEPSAYLPPRHEGYSLLRKVFVYQLALAMFCIAVALAFPEFTRQLPIGGIKDHAGSGELTVSNVEDFSAPAEDIQIVETFIRTTIHWMRPPWCCQASSQRF